jgi:hypothetical protein
MTAGAFRIGTLRRCARAECQLRSTSTVSTHGPPPAPKYLRDLNYNHRALNYNHSWSAAGTKVFDEWPTVVYDMHMHIFMHPCMYSGVHISTHAHLHVHLMNPMHLSTYELYRSVGGTPLHAVCALGEARLQMADKVPPRLYLRDHYEITIHFVISASLTCDGGRFLTGQVAALSRSGRLTAQA